MASAKVLLYKSKKKTDGRHPIVLRIIKDRKPKYIYIEWIFEKDWDTANNKVRSSHQNSKRLNNLILKKLTEADDLILESESNKKPLTSGQITKMMKGNRKGMTFLQLGKEYIADLEREEKLSRANSDKAKINCISQFLKGEDIAFHEIDESFLRKLKVYLISESQVSDRTVMNYYVVIRTLFNMAIRENIVDGKYYPFGPGKVRIKFPETIKVGLSKEEVQRVEDLDLEIGSSIWHSRNVFLFSLYFAGVRISDALKMQWMDIKDGRLYYKMGKNNKADSLPILDKAQAILNYYEEDKKCEVDYVFPELKKADSNDPKDIYTKIRTATKKFNKYLAKIAELAEIDKKLTNHISRHSFGNIAGDKIPTWMLQKLYRHTSSKTTEGYQKNFIHKDADEALESVLDF